jgi:hypothetical protein
MAIYERKVETPTLSEAGVSVVKTGKASTAFILAQDEHDNKRAALRAALALILSWPRPEMPYVNNDLKNESVQGDARAHQEGGND